MVIKKILNFSIFTKLIIILLGRNQDYRPVNYEPNEEEPGFFYKLITKPINFIASIFCDKGRNDNLDQQNIFIKLPNYQVEFKEFLDQMQKHLGILILYDDIKQEEITLVSKFVQNISQMDFLIDILRENCVITSLGLSTNQGKAVKYK